MLSGPSIQRVPELSHPKAWVETDVALSEDVQRRWAITMGSDPMKENRRVSQCKSIASQTGPESMRSGNRNGRGLNRNLQWPMPPPPPPPPGE